MSSSPFMKLKENITILKKKSYLLDLHELITFI